MGATGEPIGVLDDGSPIGVDCAPAALCAPIGVEGVLVPVPALGVELVFVGEGDVEELVFDATELSSSPPRFIITNTTTAARMATPPMPADRPMIRPVLDSELFLDFFLLLLPPLDRPPPPPPPAGIII
jgi:hypothetical protein